MRELHAAVIGLNGIGRHLAEQLSAIGVGRLTLIDSGDVHVRHHARESHFAEGAGRRKIHATAELCHRIAPLLNVETTTALGSWRLDIQAADVTDAEQQAVNADLCGGDGE